jgi:hypothetical protein
MSVSADDSPYWCLKENPNKEISAGHLLSLTYTGESTLVVTNGRFPLKKTFLTTF